MLRSLYSGISGMKNFQNKLDVIGNNISNVNTYGFKKGRVTFKDVAYQTISSASASTENIGGTNAKQIGLGATIASVDNIHTQGSVQITGRNLDVAVQGDGYLVVKQGESTFFTRDGNLTLDENGYLVNSSGMKVQANQNGVLRDLQVNLQAILGAEPTDKIALTGNLNFDVPAGEIIEKTFNVVDTEGSSHTIKMVFQKSTTADEYNAFIVNPLDAESLKTDDAQSGTLQYFNNPVQSFTITRNSATNISINTTGEQSIQVNGKEVNFTLDSYDLNSTTGANTVMPVANGNTTGTLQSFTINTAGDVIGVYSNGLTDTIGTIALAMFSNANGLEHTGNNVWTESANSGAANIFTANNGGSSIISGALEMSNVDLSEEFSDMIVAQRGFQANSRIITTSDQILEELVNLKR